MGTRNNKKNREMTIQEPVCFNCKHYDIATGICPAFTQIPDAILLDGDKHSKPLPRQGNKIIFEPITTGKNEPNQK